MDDCKQFDNEYPAEEVMQQYVVHGFEAICDVGPKHVHLIGSRDYWNRKLCMQELDGKIFCESCQAVADVQDGFLDISIIYGGNSLNCPVFEASDLFTCLENGLQKDCYILFAYIAYIDTPYMVRT